MLSSQYAIRNQQQCPLFSPRSAFKPYAPPRQQYAADAEAQRAAAQSHDAMEVDSINDDASDAGHAPMSDDAGAAHAPMADENGSAHAPTRDAGAGHARMNRVAGAGHVRMIDVSDEQLRSSDYWALRNVRISAMKELDQQRRPLQEIEHNIQVVTRDIGKAIHDGGFTGELREMLSELTWQRAHVRDNVAQARATARNAVNAERKARNVLLGRTPSPEQVEAQPAGARAMFRARRTTARAATGFNAMAEHA